MFCFVLFCFSWGLHGLPMGYHRFPVYVLGYGDYTESLSGGVVPMAFTALTRCACEGDFCPRVVLPARLPGLGGAFSSFLPLAFWAFWTRRIPADFRGSFVGFLAGLFAFCLAPSAPGLVSGWTGCVCG